MANSFTLLTRLLRMPEIPRLNSCGSLRCFLMLSGYFLIKSRGVNFRKLFALWLRIFFYSFVLFFVSAYLGASSFSWHSMAGCLMPIIQGQWWFASTYFVMYLLHPYMNILLLSMSREECRKFLLCLFICWVMIPTIFKTSFQSSGLTNFRDDESIYGSSCSMPACRFQQA